MPEGNGNHREVKEKDRMEPEGHRDTPGIKVGKAIIVIAAASLIAYILILNDRLLSPPEEEPPAELIGLEVNVISHVSVVAVEDSKVKGFMPLVARQDSCIMFRGGKFMIEAVYTKDNIVLVRYVTPRRFASTEAPMECPSGLLGATTLHELVRALREDLAYRERR
ncbi:hypothetical protein AMJ57_00585 [Parcubacteria bacterium SG8_24]|nr:MAG: hypothetical protein AMJ57_00585 [Parcubacteria bacterium SG8_24]